MQDKLIEAVAKAIHNTILEGAGSASDWDTTMPPEVKQIYRAAALAAVRAHDAGTDKGLRKARVEDAFDKIACANTVTICSLDEMESIVNRALDGEFDADLRVPPDSHAAESAPPIPFEDWWASLGKCIDPDTEDVPWFDKRKGLAEAAYCAGQSSVKFAKFYSHTKAAESTAQLDAEDPAEPVEDVVERIICRACGMAMVFRWVDTKTLETFHTCAEARKGYWSQQDVEKAILAQARGFQVIPVDELAEFLKQALAPKPSLDCQWSAEVTPEELDAAMVNYPKMDREAIFRIVSDYQAALNKRLLPKTKA